MKTTVGFAIALCIPLTPRAQPSEPESATETSPDPKAAELYSQGKRQYDLAEYRGAIDSWREAYRIAGEPLLLFNIAQAYRLAGNCAQANRFYVTYKQIVAKPSNQLELAAAMQKCAGVAAATGDSTSGSEVPVQSPQPQTDSVSPVDSAPRNTLTIAGAVAVGVGVLSGLGAIGFAISASEQGRALSQLPNGTEWTPELAQREQAGNTANTLAWSLAGVSAATVITGGALWWFSREHSSSTAVTASVNASRVEVGVSCAF